jgi:cytoskeletal protein CcmA (bactofilin family)
MSITGKVKGTVHAKERLEIKESGSVVGDIYTSCLLVDPGGFFDGQCHMPSPEPVIQAPNGVDSQEHICASTAETRPTRKQEEKDGHL